MKIAAFDVAPYEEAAFEALEQKYPVTILRYQEPLTVNNIEMAAGCDGVTTLGYSKMTRELLTALKEQGILHVSTRTIGFDHMDVKAAQELGISLSNARYDPYNVADFAVMMILVLLRKTKISICRALVNDFSLDGMQGREMRSLTIGVVGTGRIGSALIQNLSGFGCRILACDSYRNPKAEKLSEYVDMDTLLRESDVVSLHVPFTEENYHMINRESIARMKDGAILINTARGALVNSEDLIAALETGKLAGAGLDTVEEEDGIMHVDIGTRIVKKRSLLYLKQFPNVLYTQHYAFFTREACDSMVECGVLSLLAELTGKENPYRIC